jgi:hypothetical protein
MSNTERNLNAVSDGWSTAEALHEVAREYPEFYDAYRNAAFIDGSI